VFPLEEREGRGHKVKLRSVRLLGKFVFNDKPGVYKKIRHNKAQCVFGEHNVVGSEIELDPDVHVFVLDERPQSKTADRTVTVVFQDSDENVLKEIADVPWEKATVMTQVDCLSVRLPRKRKASLLALQDVGLDLENGRLLIEVREELEK